jgi:undecaprenyl-diphosphatase
MLEKILEIDINLFLFLNNLGSETYDPFWKLITKQINWIPVFIVVFYFLYQKLGKKSFLYSLLFIALLITFVDQSTNLVKFLVERLRPCSDPELNGKMRAVIQRTSFSFFSGHASNSMATTVFIFLIFRKYYKLGFLLFLFPLVFAYSRIYLGLHFPLDILSGYAFGALSGFGFYKIYVKYVLEKKSNQSNINI